MESDERKIVEGCYQKWNRVYSEYNGIKAMYLLDDQILQIVVTRTRQDLQVDERAAGTSTKEVKCLDKYSIKYKI